MPPYCRLTAARPPRRTYSWNLPVAVVTLNHHVAGRDDRRAVARNVPHLVVDAAQPSC
jgi:hypothetical protein